MEDLIFSIFAPAPEICTADNFDFWRRVAKKEIKLSKQAIEKLFQMFGTHGMSNGAMQERNKANIKEE